MRLALGIGVSVIAIYILYFVIATLVILGAWNFALVPLLNFPVIEAITAFGLALILRLVLGVLGR